MTTKLKDDSIMNVDFASADDHRENGDLTLQSPFTLRGLDGSRMLHNWECAITESNAAEFYSGKTNIDSYIEITLPAIYSNIETKI